MPLENLAKNCIEYTMSKDNNSPQTGTDYQPVARDGDGQGAKLSAAAITLTAVILATVALLLYQWLARAVIFDTEPADASLKVKGLALGS